MLLKQFVKHLMGTLTSYSPNGVLNSYKNLINDFTSQMQIATGDDSESSNDAYLNGLILLFCKNLEMKVTQLSVQEKETLRDIFSRSKPAKEHRKLRRRNPKL